MKKKSIHQLSETQQSTWDLAAIQLSSITSLPILASYVLVAKNSSTISAITIMVLSNLILWIIRYGLLYLSRHERKSTLDLATSYLGNFGAHIIAVVLLMDTLCLFLAQTTLASNSILSIHSISQGIKTNRFIQISVLIGLLSTLCCMEGIKYIKNTCKIAFPIIALSLSIVIVITPFSLNYSSATNFSLSGLPLILGLNLGMTADLPTFFRHSASWKTSVQSLTIMQVISFLTSIAGFFLISIFLSSLSESEGNILTSNIKGHYVKYFLTIFIFTSVITSNITNIYSCSVGWELIAPKKLVGRKEFLILGLGLITIYVMAAQIFSLDYILEVADSIMINLGLIFFIIFLIEKIKKSSTTKIDKKIYFTSWAIPSILNCLQHSKIINIEVTPLSTGLILTATLPPIFFAIKSLATKSSY